MSDLISAAVNSARTWTAEDHQRLADVPPNQQAQVKAQIEMQKQSEVVTLITNLMKQMHETKMAVIRNIGG